MAAAQPTRHRTAARRHRTAPLSALACLLTVLALLAALTGCGGPGGARPAPAPTDAAVRHVLDQHAAAVLHHDRAAFLAGIDPRAAAFRARQVRVFTDIAHVPLAAWSYDLVRTGAFPLPPDAGGARRTAAEVRLGYRLTGYDDRPVVSTAWLTFAERAGHWYLSGDDDGAAAGHRTDVQLWDQGPVRVVRGAHCLVLGLAPERTLRGYAADEDRAVPAVTHAWGGDWPGRVVVEAPASLAQLGALLGADPATYREIAAVTTGELGAASAAADRVLVNPEAFAGLSAFGRQVVLTHETTHVATRGATDEHTPLWLSEGTADWVAYRESGRSARTLAPELAADVRAGRVPAALPTAADFRPDAHDLAQAYEGGWLACRLIADQWSPHTLTTLYRALAQPGTLDDHLHTALGLSLPQFTARWRTYLRQELA